MTDTTLPPGMEEALEFGKKDLADKTMGIVADVYKSIARLLSLVRAGKVPPRPLLALLAYTDSVVDAAANGDALPELGSAPSSPASPTALTREQEQVLKSLKDGKIVLDRTGAPVPVIDNSAAENLLARTEKSLGLSTGRGDLEARIKRIESHVENDLPKPTDADDFVNLIGDAIGLSRKPRESNVDYAGRIGVEMKGRQNPLTTLAPITAELGVFPVKGEDTEDLIKKVVDAIKNKPSSDDFSKALDAIGKACGTPRNKGESDEDYSERLSKSVEELKEWKDEGFATITELTKLTSLKPGADEPFIDYAKRALSSLSSARRRR